MGEPDLKQMEAEASRRYRSQMTWGLIVFEVIFLWALLSTTFLLPGHWDHAREGCIFLLAGLAGLCGCGSVLATDNEGHTVRRSGRMFLSPQLVLFALVMIPVLRTVFEYPFK